MRATLTALAVLASAPASAQTCFPFDELDYALRDNFGERASVLAIADNGTVVFFYGNPNTESWSLVTLTGSCAVIIASGNAYEEVPVIAGEPM